VAVSRRRFLGLTAVALALRPTWFLTVRRVSGGADVVTGELIILSSVVDISAPVARSLLRRASAGATVLVESGATFGDEAEFLEHRDSLARLGVDVAAPRALWPRPRGGIPYVEYRWPVAASMRDYSRVIPMLPRSGDEIIAQVDGIPAALRRRVGRGTLVVLGSPIAAALALGDPEARRWLQALEVASG
jgi:hypothetical protein